MGFQAVEFLPSRASFYTTFLKKCNRGEGLGAATCLRTEIGSKQSNASERYFYSDKSSFCVS